MRPNIRIAYGSVPKDGGTFTFYRNMREPLALRGVELLCVSVGRREASLQDERFVDAGCVLLAADETSLRRQAELFSQWCAANNIDIVVGVNSEAILSSLPHLPESVRVVARSANAFHDGYVATIACYERLARIVALTPRLRDDLVQQYGVDPQKIDLIPNGANPARFADAIARDQPDKPLSLGFLGRLEHKQKGVLFLPDVVRKLSEKGVDFKLRIAGEGAHKHALQHELREWIASGRIEFTGGLAPEEVPRFLTELDVFLFPSQFEGCPNALLEAMMAGCVPVCWQIEGITDFLVKHKETGFIAPLGDTGQFAGYVISLDADRATLLAMSRAVMDDARARFSHEVTATRYASLFQDVYNAPSPSWSPLPWPNFKPAAITKRRWTALVPKPLKTQARRILYLVGLSSRDC